MRFGKHKNGSPEQNHDGIPQIHNRGHNQLPNGFKRTSVPNSKQNEQANKLNDSNTAKPTEDDRKLADTESKNKPNINNNQDNKPVENADNTDSTNNQNNQDLNDEDKEDSLNPDNTKSKDLEEPRNDVDKNLPKDSVEKQNPQDDSNSQQNNPKSEDKNGDSSKDKQNSNKPNSDKTNSNSSDETKQDTNSDKNGLNKSKVNDNSSNKPNRNFDNPINAQKGTPGKTKDPSKKNLVPGQNTPKDTGGKNGSPGKNRLSNAFNKFGKKNKNKPKDNKTSNNPNDELQNQLDNKANDSAADKAKKATQKAKNIDDKAKKTLSNINTTLNVMIAVITNPLTYIAIACLLGVVIMLSGMQIWGQSDFAKNCATTQDISQADSKAGTGSADAWLQKGTNDYKNAQQVWDAWKAQGFSGAAIAGILGNIAHEGGFAIPDRAQGHYGNDERTNGVAAGVSPTGGGAGFYQITPYTKFAPLGDKKWLSISEQTNFAVATEIKPYMNHDPYNVGGNGVGSFYAYAHLDDPVKASKAFFSMYERGASYDPAKSTSAQAAYDTFGGSSVKADDSKLKAKVSGTGSTTGSDTSDGDSSDCTGNDDSSDIDSSSVVQLAISISYPTEKEGEVTCNSLANCGADHAKDGYKQAKTLAEKYGGKDPMSDLYASCDRFVATIMKATKTDTNFPWGDTSVQAAYLASSPHWKKISCQDRKAGDVIIKPGRHIMLYIGNYKGQDSIASASYMERVASIGKMMGCDGSNFKADGYTGVIGYRHTN